jgi:plastocyanin
MRRLAVATAILLLPLVLAACGGGGATTAPAASVPAASEPAASEPAASAPGAAEACAPSTETPTVTVEIANFAYEPAEATAKVGDVVGWNNADAAPHTATLDDDSCGTGNISAGASGALVFNTAGSFPYHCAVHPNMKATLTVTE